MAYENQDALYKMAQDEHASAQRWRFVAQIVCGMLCLFTLALFTTAKQLGDTQRALSKTRDDVSRLELQLNNQTPCPEGGRQ